MTISVLCTLENSNYNLIPGLDLWPKSRNAYNYNGTNPVIAHPPCQQWSQMKGFAHPNKEELELAFFCLEKVKQNGGILEHPAGSSFFKTAGIKPTISVDQIWWGFPARKRTYLYFNGYNPLPTPLRFDLPTRPVQYMSQRQRSLMPLSFCQYLVNCITNDQVRS